MSNPMNAQYQNVNMMRANMPNGVPNDLKRAALQNNRPYVDRAALTLTLTSRPVLSCLLPHIAHCTPLTRPQQRQPHGQHGPDETAQHDGPTDAARRLADGHQRPAPPVAQLKRQRPLAKQAASR
jgi:hypothetical protein